jgi:membrane protein
MIAASLAYYAMLSIFPAGIAAVSIYGLLFEPADLESQLTDLTEALPDDAASVIGGQLESIVDASSTGLGIVTTIGILVALWSASAGTKALMSGINIAYGIAETRRFFLLRGIALVITLGAVVFIASSIALVTFLPDLLVDLGLATGWARSVTILRWPGIFFFVVLGLGVLYKVAPNRPARNIPFLTPGAGIAAALWLVATVGLSFYANNLGSFNETYGTLGGVIVLLLWFFLSGLMILLGAELNDELEERKKLGVAA